MLVAKDNQSIQKYLEVVYKIIDIVSLISIIT